ncbi:MAG: tRNA preQ1(34) S-adenosylmethionine ribosyltransferase-isomerase QueA [Candidatus Moraniibacteriota bacterium]
MHFSDLDQYDYTLPPELIRREPLEPRDSARLFVYDTATDTIRFDTFQNLAEYLPKDALLVLNDTRVRPARLWLRKPTGGKIEVFVLVNEWDGEALIPALVDRKITIGDRLSFPNGDALVTTGQEESRFFFRLESKLGLFELLDQYGVTPVPHYLETDGEPDEAALRKRYQTVFAAAGASVAAPTASLHFTETVFESLRKRDIGRTDITLDVGLGTFAPLSESSFTTGKLHREFVTVSSKTAAVLAAAKESGRPIAAVGTTVARTLETVVRDGKFAPFQGPIDTFIFPPYPFQAIDILMTNFHLTKTSLMLLVDALLKSKKAKRGIMDLYAIAIREQFAFYSFGDSMLIL